MGLNQIVPLYLAWTLLIDTNDEKLEEEVEAVEDQPDTDSTLAAINAASSIATFTDSSWFTWMAIAFSSPNEPPSRKKVIGSNGNKLLVWASITSVKKPDGNDCAMFACVLSSAFMVTPASTFALKPPLTAVFPTLDSVTIATPSME